MLLCKFGIHRPLMTIEYYFTDVVTGKKVYKTECPCGLYWMTDTTNKWLGFKVCMVK